MASITKAEALRALLEAVRADLEAAQAAQKQAHEAATHEEARPENDKDTRGLEQSYLARGLAQRVDELVETLGRLRALSAAPLAEGAAIDAPALVTVEDEDGELALYLLVPAAGGTRVEVGGVRVLVVTPQSPVGQALAGRSVDDDVVIKTPKARREVVIVAVE